VSTTHVVFSAVRVMRTLGMLGEVVGMAAAICKKHDCMPEDVYTSYLEELKESMKKGVSIPAAFACGGIGEQESYHFKDMGWWDLHSGKCRADFGGVKEPSQKEVDKFRYCINALGIRHKYPVPEEWK